MGANFVLAINMAVAALFALAFIAIALQNRADQVPRWFALAYGLGLVYILFEFLLANEETPRIVSTMTFTAFLLTLAAINVGIARRYRVPVPGRLIGAIVLVSVVVNYLSLAMPRDSTVRMVLYQSPYAIMQAIAVMVILQSGRRMRVDWGLMILFGLSALQFLLKPLVSLLAGGPGASERAYIATSYALFSQSTGAILSVATGLVMLLLLVRDMMVEVIARSETDALSGLYNRRGFDEHAEAALEAARRAGGSSALVACDLDHFKAINDTQGHEGGDRVIAWFGTLLRRMAGRGWVAGRLGGEEFVVFLPGANLAAARQFAETVRVTMADLPIEGLPPGLRVTASFGVSEAPAGATLTEIRRRADTALYAAKAAGRDRVAVADPHPFPGGQQQAG
jgi:diguanylate cyclase (GGDEF)-like protein